MDEKNNKIGIIQLTRIGDLIQAYQACKDIKLNKSDVSFVLICLKNFGKPLENILDDVFDEIIYIDVKKFILTENKQNELKECLKRVKTTINHINNVGISKLVNLSFCQSSSYLTNLILADKKIGYFKNNKLEITIKDKWSQYVYANVLGSSNNPFNLVDLFKNMILSDETSIERSLYDTPKVCSSKNIIIHPFASQERKFWKPYKWIEIIYQLLKKDSEITISIVGSKNEEDLSREIFESQLLEPFILRLHNLVGKTKIEELNKKVHDCSLFVGHDSMVGHLAAINNVPSITISMGPVRPHETTPYGTSNINISPKNTCLSCELKNDDDIHTCQLDLNYQVLTKLILDKINKLDINEDYIKKSFLPNEIENINIFCSYFYKGDLHLVDLTRELTHKEIFKDFYKILWYFILKDHEISIDFPVVNETINRVLCNYIKGLENLFELNSFGLKFSNYILEDLIQDPPNISNIKSNATKLQEIDQLTFLLKNTFPYLSPIIDYYHVLKSSLPGDNILDIAESSVKTYTEMTNSISIMYELLQKTVDNYKNFKQPINNEETNLNLNN